MARRTPDRKPDDFGVIRLPGLADWAGAGAGVDQPARCLAEGFFQLSAARRRADRQPGRVTRDAEVMAARSDRTVASPDQRAANGAAASAALVAALPGDARVVVRDRLPRFGAFHSAPARLASCRT